MNSTKKAIAWVKYWNMFPLKHEFAKIIKNSINIIEDHPKKINALVREEKVQSGPCSSICLNLYPKMKKTSSHGVCALDHVYSVIAVMQGQEDGVSQHIKKRNTAIKKILHNFNLNNSLERNLAWKEIFKNATSNQYKNPPKLVFSADSETSVQLLKLLSFIWFGKINDHQHSQDSWSLNLIIGNKALNYFFDKKNHANNQILDLGHQWYELTALPFVYAVWQSTKKKDPKLNEALNEAAIKAEQYMREDPHKYLDMLETTAQHESQLIPYWKKIYYRMSIREETALNVFLEFSQLLEVSVSKKHDLDLKVPKNDHLSLRH